MKKIIYFLTIVLSSLLLFGCSQKVTMALVDDDGSKDNKVYIYVHRGYKSLNQEYDILEMNLLTYVGKHNVDVQIINKLNKNITDGMLIELREIRKISKGYSTVLVITSNNDGKIYFNKRIWKTKTFGYAKASRYLASDIGKYLKKAYSDAHNTKEMSK